MSKVVKTISWVSPKGAKIEVKIEISKSVEKDISYSDGWNVDLGNKVEEFKKISVYINGNYHEGTYNNPVVVEDGTFLPDYKAKVKAAGYYARLTDTVIISKEKYNLIMAEITSAEAEVEAEFKKENAEVVAEMEKAEKEKAAAEAKAQIRWAEKIMAEVETRVTEILSAADEKQWRVRYNNTENEGGEGYVPHRATIESVAKAKSIISNASKQIATVVRVSDSASRVEYEPMELDVNLKNIADKFGKCEFGEIIYVEVAGELVLAIYWDSQAHEYKNAKDRY